jgi:hypothetical protein
VLNTQEVSVRRPLLLIFACIAAFAWCIPVHAAPALQYAMYIRGFQQSGGRAVAVDRNGNVFVAGSWNDGTGHTGGFVLKLDAAGKTIVWRDEFDASINTLAVDANGNCYIAGSIASSGYWPVVNAYQAVPRGSTSAVMAKLDPTGRPIYSTYLGGTGVTTALGITVDGKGEPIVVGSAGTGYPQFAALPATVAFGGDKPGRLVAFASKLSTDGQHLVWSTTLGASGVSSAYSVATESRGQSAYLAVSTGPGELHFPATYRAKGFTTTNPTTAIVKLVQGKSHLALGYSVRTTDSCLDCGGIAIDAVGEAYVATAQRVFKVNARGTALLWSRTTTLPGGLTGNVRAMALSPSGTTTVTGAIDDPALGEAQPLTGTGQVSDGAYIGQVSSTGKLLFSSFLPSAWGYGIAVGGKGNAVLTGIAVGAGFPTLNDMPDSQPIPQCDPSTPSATAPVAQCPTAFVAKLVGS